MKIKLPHRTVVFTEEDKTKTSEERVEMVNQILKEKFLYKKENIQKEITVNEYLTENFNNQSAIVVMDMLSYFMIKEYKKKEDIISRKGIQEMKKNNKKVVNFTNLSADNKTKIGIDCDLEDSY